MDGDLGADLAPRVNGRGGRARAASTGECLADTPLPDPHGDFVASRPERDELNVHAGVIPGFDLGTDALDGDGFGVRAEQHQVGVAHVDPAPAVVDVAGLAVA